MEATVLTKTGDSITVYDKNNVIYTFNSDKVDCFVHGNVLLEYTGVLDKSVSSQDVDISNCKILNTFDEDDVSVDEWNDNGILPFKEGIKEGAEAILVSHNVISSIDSSYPASLSIDIHNILREMLEFSGIIISDDISMGALDGIKNKSVLALMAGNDMVITSNYMDDINEIRDAIEDEELSVNLINKLATRVVAWKYYKGLMYENQK